MCHSYLHNEFFFFSFMSFYSNNSQFRFIESDVKWNINYEIKSNNLIPNFHKSRTYQVESHAIFRSNLIHFFFLFSLYFGCFLFHCDCQRNVKPYSLIYVGWMLWLCIIWYAIVSSAAKHNFKQRTSITTWNVQHRFVKKWNFLIRDSTLRN